MARINNLSDFLTDVANSIRAKKGTVDPIAAANFDAEISSIPVAGNIEPTKSVTPTTSAQTILPTEGYDGMAEVNVSAVTAGIDANIIANNIAQGVTILGVEGTYDGGVAAALGGAY